MHDERPPEPVLGAWDLESASVSPISIGLINRTYRVDHPRGSFILQRLNPIFRGELHHDIDAITRHLEARGVRTPRLLTTADARLWLEDASGVWRLQTLIEGRAIRALSSPSTARAAGRGVARFHRALTDLDHVFRFTRPGAHDTPRHLAHLREVLEEHGDHPRFGEVAKVAERILRRGEALPTIPPLPRRIIHGDLKCTNVVFDEALEFMVALVDLDTLAHGDLAVEMGDALRSWCNPAGEDEVESRVDVSLFEAAIGGYAEGAGETLTAEERASLVPGMQTIALELASRFCADALEESYFGWNAERYPTRGEHNRIRALSQLALANSVGAERASLERAVEAAFAGLIRRPDATSR